MESMRRNLKRKVLLRNREKKIWEIELSKIGDVMFFGNGWEKVVKDNCVLNGDHLFFIYNSCGALFDFFVVDPFGCEKIGVDGEHARVVEFIRNGSGDKSHDVFVLEADICCIVKKYVKKEQDIDTNMVITEEDDNCNNDDHDALYHEKKRYNNHDSSNSSGSKRDASVKKSTTPEHFGADLFLSGRYIQPENAYFVTKMRRKRRHNLYIPKEVIMDYNLRLPPSVTLRDMGGREWTSHVRVWRDGRTWLSGGWRDLCDTNLVGNKDRCICKTSVSSPPSSDVFGVTSFALSSPRSDTMMKMA
nr:B3 domain-containing protein At5g60130-like isoform X2 [Ipomoea trifida]